jgi:hypothetical protein
MKALTVLTLSVCAISATEIIPLSRRVPWQGNVGIPGGIPNSDNMTVFASFTSSATAAQVATSWSSCPSNQVITLAAGTYNWSGSPTIDFAGRGNGKVLKGATNSSGVPTTRIKGSALQFYLRNAADENALTVDANLTADGNKGDTSITLASVPAWVTVGDVIGIDALDDPTIEEPLGQEGTATFPGHNDNYRYVLGQGDRGLAQQLKVTAKTSTTITFSPELSETFTTAKTAQIFQPLRDPSNAGFKSTTRCGFENIIFEDTGAAVTDNHLFKVELAKECWWKNVWATNSVGGAYIYLLGSYNCEVRHCYFDNAVGLAGGQGYGVALYHWCCYNLIEDNIFRKLHVGMQSNYGSTYNAWMYNYETDGQSDSGQNPSMSGHGYTAHKDIFEGNWCMDKYLGDYTHGSGAYSFTIFRNRIVGKNTSQTGDQEAISSERYSRLPNIVGNVLGSKAYHTHYIEAPSGGVYTGHGGSVTSSCVDDAIYKFGYWANISCDLTSQDSYANQNPIMDVNYNTVTSTNNGIVLGASLVADLGSSYVYASKPAVFGAISPWPPYGPDILTGTNSLSYTNIPAGFRFATGLDTPQSGGGGTTGGGGFIGTSAIIGSSKLSGGVTIQ